MNDGDSKPNILIVDDTPENIRILVSLLKDRYRPLIATNGEKALEQAASAIRPDLILLDIMMPGMDGYEVCRKLKMDELTRDIPVIFITAMTEVEDESHGFEVGAVDYITKPFQPTIVEARVRTHVQIHRLEMKLQHKNEEIERKNQENEQLLLNILPRSIAERLKAGENLIVDTYPDVSIMFADIVGFTKLAGSLGAEDTVTLLNDLFSRFDTLASQHRVEKIKTIGDCYMAVCGVPESNDHHAEAIMNMAVEMIQVTQELNDSRLDPLELRVGLNTGPVVAGIIGTSKFIYDLWGDTVNVASRMESHGLPGQVQVTAQMQAKLRSKFDFVDRGEIDVKGKGSVQAYLLKA
jgi:class 3 adenylate cyclase